MPNIQNSLLIEFLSEELPPINLNENIGLPFANAVISQLNGFTNANSEVKPFVSPRRFGVLINGIKFEEDNQQVVRKGPAISTGLVNDEPTKALLGFAKSCNTEWDKLERRDDGYFYFTSIQQGKTLNAIIGDVIANAIKKIHVAKAMRWGNKEYQFVRPLHNLMVMFDDQVLDCLVMGLYSNNKTVGHRFMGSGNVDIFHAREYFDAMQSKGDVVPEFDTRKAQIISQLDSAATSLDLQISHIDGLLEEVTALVEYPEVLIGEFDRKFLEVPQECLILSMAKNQKYFALLDKSGKLENKFLFVANLKSKHPQTIIDGNQKVLTARLADAEFFYNFDKRTKLCEFVSKMANVVYHNKLGSQLERIQRLQKIAGQIAPLLGVDSKLASDTAYLLKADLATEMVGEFPELQGVMGRYYTLASGETAEVANAIEKHYYPRFSGDELPDSNLATIVSLADKLEALVGIWGIGLIPTGDKDPYALRRAALGVVRILLTTKISLVDLVNIAYDSFVGKNLAVNTANEVHEFIIQRLANYLISVENYPAKVVNAVLFANQIDFINLRNICDVFNLWSANSKEGLKASLLESNKRIENILTKNKAEIDNTLELNEALLLAKEEQDLHKIYQAFSTNKPTSVAAYLEKLSTEFAEQLAQFFANVMVMDENLQVRKNRLNLLSNLYSQFNYYGKLSELV